MSENLIHSPVAEEIHYLAELSGADCEAFQHEIINSKRNFAGPGMATVIDYTIPENLAWVITQIDIKVLYDTADALLLGGDFRSSFDLNPYGPYVGIGAVGQVQLLVNSSLLFAPAWDIGVINAGVLFVITGGDHLQIQANPLQPAAKNLTLVTRCVHYVVSRAVASELKKKETRVITQTLP